MEGLPYHRAYSGHWDGRSLARIRCLKTAYVPPSHELCALTWWGIWTTTASSWARSAAAGAALASAFEVHPSCNVVRRDATAGGLALPLQLWIDLPVHIFHHVLERID